MTPEGQVLKSITDFLAVRKIWHRRMNTGAIVSEHAGKRRFHRYGSVGMADVLASVDGFLWIEAKAGKGKQSEAQKEFQAEVEAQGHRYIVARSIEDVAQVLEGGAATP